MKITISIGNSRMERRWNRITLTLEELRERICTTRRTAETVEQYRKMPKAQQDSIKDVGGFVMGTLRDGRRRKENVVSRSGLTLDMDYAASDTIDHLEMFTSFHCMIYSTHKHTPEKPRLRLIVPLAREVTPDEYIAVARKVAEEIGIEQFDDTTYEPSRLMYWPSTSADGEFVFREIAGDLLAPDAVLAKYTNWRNVAEWPVSNRQQTLVQRDAQRQADPLTKTGAVGAFCRTYSIRDAIETFLPSVYKPSAMPGRYDYIPADSQAGVVIYEEKFCYSHHASDPVCGQLLNAFDVVRLHKFGQLDAKTSEDTDPCKRPSFKAMQEFAVQDERVKSTLAAERMAQAQQEFDSEDEWQRQLDLDRTGAVRNTLRNITLIVQHDPALKDIVFNQLADSMEIKGDVPWKHPARFWRDADDAQLISYVDSFYGSFSARNYELAITKVTDDRSYHPIREFLNALPEWDRTVRADTLLIDYLGAADTAYVRAVTRKTLCAAVARVQHPGTKFDNILVLNGPQGIGKSTLIALLGGEWYSDSLSISDMNDKTAAEKLQGFWIMEIGELAGMRKADIDKVKAFISRQDDKYRASFGRRVTPHPRQCIFFGTTNSEKGYLRDITGNRRFWTVKVPGGSEKHPWELKPEDVQQIWAEVLTYVSQGEKLYLNADLEAEARMEQRDAMEQDEREGLVRAFLDRLLPECWDTMDVYRRQDYIRDSNDPTHPEGTQQRTQVCNMEIWCECFGKRKEDLSPGDSYAISTIMERVEGWEKTGKFSKPSSLYGRQRLYERV